MHIYILYLEIKNIVKFLVWQHKLVNKAGCNFDSESLEWHVTLQTCSGAALGVNDEKSQTATQLDSVFFLLKWPVKQQITNTGFSFYTQMASVIFYP